MKEISPSSLGVTAVSVNYAVTVMLPEGRTGSASDIRLTSAADDIELGLVEGNRRANYSVPVIGLKNKLDIARRYILLELGAVTEGLILREQ